ncbi:DUF1840 domain-containing protein [Paraglaciecola sp. 25GB23A]|uniref:DUF1840 domain-containing protein n=1 Tax=Paraglaciecola sp. 25GB23A TaxID=3156068 RepID=UPI0032AE8716
MLVTFSCRATANITMFGDVAVQLIKMMEHSGTVPSAILAKDVASALRHLEAALATTKEKSKPEVSEEDNEEGSFVSLPNRASPLIAMLEAAIQDESNVSWTSNS